MTEVFRFLHKNERWKYVDHTLLEKFSGLMGPGLRGDDKGVSSPRRRGPIQIEEIIHEERLENVIKIVFLNGHLQPECSDLHLLPPGVVIQSVDDASHSNEDKLKCFYQNIDEKKYPFAKFNLSHSQQGTLFYFPKNLKLEKTIHLLSMNDADEMIHPQRFIVMSENTTIKMIDEYVSTNKSSAINVVSQIKLEKNATLEFIKIQCESNMATHLAHTFVEQQDHSSFILNNFGFGAQFARDEIAVSLLKPHAICETNGFYHLQNDKQYIDYHIDISHQAEHSKSEMFYKGVIDQAAKAVFNGRLHVQKQAQKIEAHQTNHHLLLSKQAESYSKPELEVYANDVKCKHGATTGQIDEAALFYLQARGIDQKLAINMLLQGFASEVIDKLKDDQIKKYIKGFINHEINRF